MIPFTVVGAPLHYGVLTVHSTLHSIGYIFSCSCTCFELDALEWAVVRMYGEIWSSKVPYPPELVQTYFPKSVSWQSFEER